MSKRRRIPIADKACYAVAAIIAFYILITIAPRILTTL